MNAINIQIREASVSDAIKFHSIHTRAVNNSAPQYYTPDIIEGWLKNRGVHTYIPSIERGEMFAAEVKGQVVGFGEAVSGEVIGVFVDPEFMGMGIGGVVLDAATKIALRAYKGPVRLFATLNAVSFYKAKGWVMCGRHEIPRNDIMLPVMLMQYGD